MYEIEPEIRLLSETDSIDELTALLPRAYAPLGARGLRYTAVSQDAATTRERASKGECYVLADGPTMLGTIVIVPPLARWSHCAWYDRPGVSVVTQFGIEPSLQRRGLGSRLMDFVEQRAADLGASEIALDTAEPATHLIALYEARGYRCIGHEQWKHTNYRSVILSKTLGPATCAGST
jgi:GNAT superfamily N-acetyltransferase